MLAAEITGGAAAAAVDTEMALPVRGPDVARHRVGTECDGSGRVGRIGSAYLLSADVSPAPVPDGNGAYVLGGGDAVTIGGDSAYAPATPARYHIRTDVTGWTTSWL
jgi:hypothetical protein